MKYLDLDDLKKHLNIDEIFVDDDEYIKSLGDVAEEIISKHLDIDLSVLAARYQGDIPAPVKHACKLLVGNLYANRESVVYTAVNDLPLSYEYLLEPYHNYSNSKL